MRFYPLLVILLLFLNFRSTVAAPPKQVKNPSPPPPNPIWDFEFQYAWYDAEYVLDQTDPNNPKRAVDSTELHLQDGKLNANFLPIAYRITVLAGDKLLYGTDIDLAPNDRTSPISLRNVNRPLPEGKAVAGELKITIDLKAENGQWVLGTPNSYGLNVAPATNCSAESIGNFSIKSTIFWAFEIPSPNEIDVFNLSIDLMKNNQELNPYPSRLNIWQSSFNADSSCGRVRIPSKVVPAAYRKNYNEGNPDWWCKIMSSILALSENPVGLIGMTPQAVKLD